MYIDVLNTPILCLTSVACQTLLWISPMSTGRKVRAAPAQHQPTKFQGHVARQVSNAKEKRHLIPVYELSGIKAEQLTELSVRAVSVWFIFYSVSTLFTHPKATER